MLPEQVVTKGREAKKSLHADFTAEKVAAPAPRVHPPSNRAGPLQIQ